MKLILALFFLLFLPVSCTTIPGDDPVDPPIDEPIDEPKEDLKELLSLINNQRERVGLSPLSQTTKLTCAAKKHSEDMGTYKFCSHTGRYGSSPWDRARECGTEAHGEIIACGQSTPTQAVIAWMNSPAHRKLMLHPDFKSVGLGMHKNYWTAIFSR